MGIAIPQVITSDRATGAQVIDGSVGFTSESKTHLTRTPSSAGNRKTWTWTGWVKRGALPSNHTALFTVGTTVSDSGFFRITFHANGHINVATGSTNILYSGGKLRDLSAWYHVLVSVDTTASSNQVKCYLNGTLYDQATAISNVDTAINSTEAHQIGRDTSETTHANINLAQVHFVDGQALGPEYFGFTDPLTNTWKPKKYINTTASHGDAAGVVGFGTNGFYLPLDGSAPIGQDQSGQGNNWTPVNFGGSVELDSPLVTGARPVLNTTQGGSQAAVGVFGSKQNVGYAVTVYNDGGGNKYYIDGVKQATLTGLIRGATYTFDTSDSTVSSHPFRFSATSNGSHGGGSEYTNGVAKIQSDAY